MSPIPLSPRQLLSTLVVALCAGAACSKSATEVGPTVFTHPQGIVLDSVPVSARPFGLAVSANDVLYVARLDADSLGRGDLPSTAVAPSAEVGTTPSHVAFNPAGTTAYASDQGSRDVSVVNVATNTATAAVPVASDAWNVIVSPDGTRLYATTDQGDLVVVNTSNNSVVKTLTLLAGDALRGLAVDKSGRWLYVGGCLTGLVYVVDARTNAFTQAIFVGGIPQHLAVSGDGAHLYVADEIIGVDIVTVGTGAVHKIPLAGGGYGLALSPDGAQLYVSIPSRGMVAVVDPAAGSVLQTLTVSGTPRGIAFSHSGAYAVIANEAGWVTFVH